MFDIINRCPRSSFFSYNLPTGKTTVIGIQIKCQYGSNIFCRKAMCLKYVDHIKNRVEKSPSFSSIKEADFYLIRVNLNPNTNILKNKCFIDDKND